MLPQKQAYSASGRSGSAQTSSNNQSARQWPRKGDQPKREQPQQPQRNDKGEIVVDPIKFAADVEHWKNETKIPTDRGPIDRTAIPKQIHTGEMCPQCQLPKVKLVRGEAFCFGCGYRADLHGYGGRLDMKGSPS